MIKIKSFFPFAIVRPVVFDGQPKTVVYSEDTTYALILGMGKNEEEAIANGIHNVSLMAAVGSI